MFTVMLLLAALTPMPKHARGWRLSTARPPLYHDYARYILPPSSFLPVLLAAPRCQVPLSGSQELASLWLKVVLALLTIFLVLFYDCFVMLAIVSFSCFACFPRPACLISSPPLLGSADDAHRAFWCALFLKLAGSCLH